MSTVLRRALVIATAATLGTFVAAAASGVAVAINADRCPTGTCDNDLPNSCPNGSTKPIEAVMVGDLVATTDPTTDARANHDVSVGERRGMPPWQR